jgi:hypothetical protein
MTKRSINPRTEESSRARGPDHQRLQHRRELERVRKRVARKRQTSEQLERERERKRRRASSRRWNSESMSTSVSGKHGCSERRNSASVRKSGTRGATARS